MIRKGVGVLVLAAVISFAGFAGRSTARPLVTAASGGDATVISKNFTVEAGGRTIETVFCPARMRAIGGGVGLVEQSGPDASYQLESSVPVIDGGSPLGWYVSIYDYDKTAREFEVFVICSAAGDVTVSTAGQTLEIGYEYGIFAASCPNGSRPTGGGVGFIVNPSQSPPDWVLMSQPTAAGWVGGVKQYLNSANRYDTYVICSLGTDATIVSSGLGGVVSKAYATRVAKCPAGRRAVGGGVSIDDPTYSSAVGSTGPVDETYSTTGTDTGDVARGWKASVYNGDGVGHAYTVYALCVTDAPAPPPPPPPPPPPKPKLSSTKASFGNAKAGSAFTVSFTVKDQTTGKGVRGSLSCKAKLAGRALGTTHRSTSSSGKGSCTWKLPKGSHGDTFAGTISETYKGVKTSRSFSTKVT